MFPETTFNESRLDAMAMRIARKCRHIIQGCLREEEWGDADHEFYMVIREELKELIRQRRGEGK